MRTVRILFSLFRIRKKYGPLRLILDMVVVHVNKIPYISPYAPLPSRPMVIRRYRRLTKKKYLRTYFTEGLFCHRLTEFDDDDDGLLERMAEGSSMVGALAANSANEEVASICEFRKAFEEYHEDARFQLYANCWRLGTDEKAKIWKRYTEESMVEGCAIETTVGQLMSILPTEPTDPNYETGKSYNEGSDFGEIYKTPPEGMSINGAGNDIRVGACRYQQRMDPDTGQPHGIRAAIPFFKGEDFDIENEFRLLLNPYSSNVQVNTNDDGTPTTFRPDSSIFLKFPVDMKPISNAVILAPNAGTEQMRKVKKWLREFYGSATERSKNIDIQKSSLAGGRLQQSRNYISELGGLDNYTQTFDEVGEILDSFIEKRSWNVWPLLDIVIIHTDQSGLIVEAYWHKTKNPELELDDYGHDEFQSVIVMRFSGPDRLVDTRTNENAENSDAVDVDITHQ